MGLPQKDKLKRALQEEGFYNKYNQPYQDGVTKQEWRDQHGKGTMACPKQDYSKNDCSQLWGCKQNWGYEQN